MRLLTEPTVVFAAEASGRCAVVFLCRRLPGVSRTDWTGSRTGIERALDSFEAEGWKLSVRSMMDPRTTNSPTGYATGFAHDVDMAGMFEAPTLEAALAGTVRLEEAGWSRIVSTEWLIGPREFAATTVRASGQPREWALIALWEWNDAWCLATPNERRAYDVACDEAFAADLATDIRIAGRHRLDWATRWHHVAVWEAPSPEVIDAAMRNHDRVADFKFTTSRHYMGRRYSLLDLIGEPYG
ncbi:MAG: hypothetical protein ACYCS9_04495 [Candidatus Dormibacteria bacterium]